MCDTHHTCIYYLYNMIFWRSISVVLTMSQLCYKLDFNQKVLFTKFVSLHQGCHIKEHRTKKLGLYRGGDDPS